MKKMMIMLCMVSIWMAADGEVILTGIMDGTLTGGKPKVIELFIAGTEDLGGYEIWRSQNGDPFGAGAGSVASLSGIYSNTFVYLVKSDHVAEFHSVFGDSGFYAHVLPLAIVTGNGNEGFQIRDTVGDVVIDQVWLEDPTDSYRDSYWYRIHGTGPDGTWMVTSWMTPGNDALDGLDEAGLRAAVPFGSYAIAWKGYDQDWGNTSNWSFGIIPSYQINVVIPDTAGSFPVVNNPPESPAECLDLTIIGSATLVVAAAKALTVHGSLHLSGPGTDMLVLDSDSSSTPTGSLISRGAVSGEVQVKRYIPKDNSWHFLSSPVTGQSIQPVFAPDPPDNTFDLYSWQESEPPGNGWMNIRDDNGNLNPLFDTEFQVGKGYLVAYSGNYQGEAIKTFSGGVNSGDISIILGHSTNHWNLCGNPYPCALDWSSEGIDKIGVAGGAMYLWDQSLNAGLGGYRTHNGTMGVPAGTSPFIPAMNGFFVYALQEGSLDIETDSSQALVHNPQQYYKNNMALIPDRARFRISHDDFGDETLVLFAPDATNFYDPQRDVLKLANGVESAPEIATLTGDQEKLCMNMLNSYPVTIPLHIEFSIQDSLELSIYDHDDFNPDIGIYLEDLLTGTTWNLREDPVYHFLHMVPGMGNRFLVHFSDAVLTSELVQPAKRVVFVHDGTMTFMESVKEDSNFRIYDISGRLVDQGTTGNIYDIRHLVHGVYIVEVIQLGISNRQKFIH